MGPEQRQKAMRSNRGRTRPERALAAALWRMGFRYLTADGYRRRYGKRLLGQPDLIFTRRKAVVFVDGCFWHGCRKCRRMAEDYPNEFWQRKISGNVERDRRITRGLRREGWKVIRVPEHAVRGRVLLGKTADRVAERLGT
jgi:DNA mismatch endonuclease (patch repair protein)